MYASTCVSYAENHVMYNVHLLPPSWITQYVYAQPDQAAVVKGIFVPWCQNCSSGAVEQGLGLIGAVIMPHNLYLHSGLVLVSHKKHHSTQQSEKCYHVKEIHYP